MKWQAENKMWLPGAGRTEQGIQQKMEFPFCKEKMFWRYVVVMVAQQCNVLNVHLKSGKFAWSVWLNG